MHRTKNVIIYVVITLLVMANIYADNSNMTLFPIEHYSQDVDKWLNPELENYHTQLLTPDYQQQRLNELKNYYFGNASPWGRSHIEFVLNSQTESKNVFKAVQSSLEGFNNSKLDEKHIAYGMNHRPYPQQWWAEIAQNANINQFVSLKYNKKNRAIAVTNLSLRSIPTADPAYYNHTMAGEGYPFDNVSLSAAYAGTPLYILGTSSDQAWKLVMLPEYIGWVRADGVANVDDDFINTYQHAAYQNLAGIIDSNVSVVDANGNYMFSGYVGMLFPLLNSQTHVLRIILPKKSPSGKAIIATANLSRKSVLPLPLSATPANFALVLHALQGRPYGWGSLGFYTDCSAEMKSIYTLFGIFMPRNTKHQLLAGKVIDISKLTNQQRLDYLIKNADPLFTLVRIKGHILMYVGTYQRADGSLMAMSYQQMWGLAPPDRKSRSVIGQSVFLPLLLKYSEDTSLMSELDAGLFQLIYLDQFPDVKLTQGIEELMY